MSYVSTSGDVDYYEFTLAGLQQVRIDFAVPAGVDYWIELEGDNITAHTRVDEYVHGDERLDITLSAGTYYIRVTGFSFDDVNSYTLSLTAPLTGDDFEPNNTPDTPTPLQLGDDDQVVPLHARTTTTGTASSRRRTRISSSASTFPITADYDLVLTTAAGSYIELSSQFGAGRDEQVVVTVPAGTYLVARQHARQLLTGGSGTL